MILVIWHFFIWIPGPPLTPVLQATSGASRMVKSKSMEVMKAVQEDLGEVVLLHSLFIQDSQTPIP